MSKARRNVIGLAALVLVFVLAGLGWTMRARLKSMVVGPPGGGSPASLPLPQVPARATGAGVARLSWSPIEPAGTGASADPVTGFRVYVGTSPDDLHLEASIADATATGYVVERLPKGTFYYTVTTFTKLGVESPRPAPVFKTIE